MTAEHFEDDEREPGEDASPGDHDDAVERALFRQRERALGLAPVVPLEVILRAARDEAKDAGEAEHDDEPDRARLLSFPARQTRSRRSPLARAGAALLVAACAGALVVGWSRAHPEAARGGEETKTIVADPMAKAVSAAQPALADSPGVRAPAPSSLSGAADAAARATAAVSSCEDESTLSSGAEQACCSGPADEESLASDASAAPP